MADRTHIEWTDATWNIITGCSVVSAGCKHCYAMKLAGTRLAHHPSREGLTIDTAAGPVWNGEVRFNDRWLLQPLDWARPRRIFVCAHGDLFHESVPDEWICAVFAIMASAPQHTFQVLTKRPQRARRWFERMRDRATAEGYLHECLKGRMGYYHPRRPAVNLATWPLPNVWLGVSVEDQAAADARIPDLLRTPAAVRWLSAEPLLGPVDLSAHIAPPDLPFLTAGTPLCRQLPSGVGCARSGPHYPREYGCRWSEIFSEGSLPGLNWVIVGGESGPGARPMHPDWVRSLRDQCTAAGVPFLFKQWGSWAGAGGQRDALPHAWMMPDGTMHPYCPADLSDPLAPKPWSHAEDPQGIAFMAMCGKRKAGRLLDGIEHNAFPEVAHA